MGFPFLSFSLNLLRYKLSCVRSSQVSSSCIKQSRISVLPYHEVIASKAQQPSYLSCFMIVVYSKTFVEGRSTLHTNSTAVSLGSQKIVVFL
jgi:hypothetical protein